MKKEVKNVMNKNKRSDEKRWKKTLKKEEL